MKSLITIGILLLPGCAYTARDIYRNDHEIILRNASASSAIVHVTNSGEETVTNVASGEQRTVYYEKIGNDKQRLAKVRVTRSKFPDARIDILLEPTKPSFLKLWDIHDVLLSDSGDLILER